MKRRNPLARDAASLVVALGAGGAAQAQKKLVVYTSNESTLNDLVFGAFRRRPASRSSRSPPDRRGDPPPAGREGAAAGRHHLGRQPSLLQTNKALFEPYASKNKDATPADYRDPDDLWIGNNLHLLVILQNTKLVPADQGPKGWADLLDPKWKGKIAFTDPANSARPMRR
jgi:iron(III) transport system substrate-binding protein